jgi:integrase
MANKVTIVVRPRTGSRCPVTATGNNDPVGSYFLRHCAGGKAIYSAPMESYDEAYAAKITLENKLQIEARGGIAPVEVPAGPKMHRCDAAVKSYVAWLHVAKKKNGRFYTKSSIKAREAHIAKFLDFCKLAYFEQISRTTLLKYKAHLEANLANDTVINNLMSICSWMRKNQLVKIVGLLETDDWPASEPTKANPYHDEEIKKMMAVATDEEHLLLRTFMGTGCRKSEIAHLEKSDIAQYECAIKINSKMGKNGMSDYQWETKTKKGERTIFISPELKADLLARPGSGLLFPCKSTGRPDKHLERIVQAVALRAGIVAPAKADWCHRWRDVFATMQVQAGVHDLLTIARMLGHSDLKTLDVYVEWCTRDTDNTRRAAAASDPYGQSRKGPQLVKAG